MLRSRISILGFLSTLVIFKIAARIFEFDNMLLLLNIRMSITVSESLLTHIKLVSNNAQS